jgi:plastocyanin
MKRSNLLLAVLIPVGSLAVIVTVLFLFSRVLLRVTHTAATATALVAALGILAVAAYVASRKEVEGASTLSLLGGFLGVAMLAGGVALVAGQPGEEAEGETGVVVAVTAPAGAAASGFAETELLAPADQAFTIAFDNQDPQVPHNVWVATADPLEDPAAASLFEGVTINGPARVDYAVDPLAAGEYFFYCQVHPTTMNGTLTASVEAAAPAEEA